MIIYLASPYTHRSRWRRWRRYREVCAIAGRLMRKHPTYTVFSPIAHSHAIASLVSLPVEWDYWSMHDKRFIQASDEVWIALMAGWRDSRGIKAEIEIAESLGKPVHLLFTESLSTIPLTTITLRRNQGDFDESGSMQRSRNAEVPVPQNRVGAAD